MLTMTINAEQNRLSLEVAQEVTKGQYTPVLTAVDAFLQAGGTLSTLLVYASETVEWDAVAATVSMLKFSEGRQLLVARIAVVTDDVTGVLSQKLRKNFVNAHLQIYCFNELDAALCWLDDCPQEVAA